MSNGFWVNRLIYDLEQSKELIFQNCPPVQFQHPLGTFSLSNNVLSVSLALRIDSREAARAAVERVLEVWKVQIQLDDFTHRISFRYRSSDIEPKEPLPPGSGAGSMELPMLRVSASGVQTLTCSTYPQPPKPFVLSPDVRTLWERYKQAMSGVEPLPSMAYFVSTFLKGCDDERNYFNVSANVRDRLRVLSSTRGDPLTARKADFRAPLSDTESEWLRVVVCEIIRRAGQFSAGIAPSQLTMADLPALSA